MLMSKQFPKLRCGAESGKYKLLICCAESLKHDHIDTIC